MTNAERELLDELADQLRGLLDENQRDRLDLFIRALAIEDNDPTDYDSIYGWEGQG